MLALFAATLLTTALAQPTGKIGEIPPALDRLRPADWFGKNLSYTSTSIGTSGCVEIFGKNRTLSYTAQDLDDDATDVGIPVSAFAINGLSCSGDGEDGYTVSARVPGRESAFGARGAQVIDSASPILEHLFYLKRDVGGLTRATCSGHLRLGDALSIMYSKNKRIVTPYPRKANFTYKENHMYLKIVIGIVDKPDEVCILTAGESDKKTTKDSSKEGGKTKNTIEKEKTEVSGGVIAVSIVGAIAACVAVGGVLTYVHFGR